MFKMTHQQASDYFRKSYTSADALWFVKTEEKIDFQTALDLDCEVWKVMPKIQARLIKKMSGFSSGLSALKECLTAILSIESFSFEQEEKDPSGGFIIRISSCPWHDAMVKSGREALSSSIGEVICRHEYEVWASEFGENICFKPGLRICGGDSACVLSFFLSA